MEGFSWHNERPPNGIKTQHLTKSFEYTGVSCRTIERYLPQEKTGKIWFKDKDK